MAAGFFIAGTDTEVGKTWSTVALMRYFRNQGKSVIGMKPVASGSTVQNGMLKNADALLLQKNASLKIEYDYVNPYAFALPVSPHIAAAYTGCYIDLSVISNNYQYLCTLADIVLVEGAGGWFAPLNAKQDIADLAKCLGLPVILVVAIRLGCINHAKLTYHAICASGVQCVGWIASCTDPEMLFQQENINTIQETLAAPLLGVFPYREMVDFDFFTEQLNLADVPPFFFKNNL